VTYARKIEKDEARIAWTRPWSDVHNHIRGLSPFPGAWFEIAGEGDRKRAGQAEIARIKVLRTTKGEGAGAPGTVLDDRLTVACAEGALRILELQRAGRQAMKTEEFLRGTPVAAGTRLG
jgi:methionyl-tRNA formyltransferase